MKSRGMKSIGMKSMGMKNMGMMMVMMKMRIRADVTEKPMIRIPRICRPTRGGIIGTKDTRTGDGNLCWRFADQRTVSSRRESIRLLSSTFFAPI